MSEPVTYKKYLPICSIPQNCIISKFMTFAPRDCFHGYHILFASTYIRFVSRQQLNDQPYLIRWLIIKMKARE